MSTTTTLFEPEKFFTDDASQIELISDAFKSGEAAYIANAIGIVARARGMSGLAREAGVTREALYTSLSENGNPTLSTLLAVLKGLGFELSAGPRRTPDQTASSLNSSPR